MQDEYDNHIEWYEKQIYGKEAPSSKYRRADRIRHKDLAYESGGYIRIAPTINLSETEQTGSITDFKKMVNDFRKRHGWEEYT